MKRTSILAVVAIATFMMALGLAACGSSGASSSASSNAAGSSSAAASGSSASGSSASSEGSEAAASSSSSSAEAVIDGSAYGYAGDDPVELAIYKYVTEEIGGQFEKADTSIPLVDIVHVDYTNPDEVIVSGDFWVFNYNIEGDTLENVSGGNFPGVMHLAKAGDGYVVSSFDKVADGAGYEESARELFGEHYDDFARVHSDDEARAELRKIAASDYVNLNGLAITQYHDGGWDPVPLYKK